VCVCVFKLDRSKKCIRKAFKIFFEYIVDIIMLYNVTAAIINKENLTQKLGSI